MKLFMEGHCILIDYFLIRKVVYTPCIKSENIQKHKKNKTKT